MNFLLKWLFHHMMFAGTMFFAAGAVAVSGGEGAGAPPVSAEGGEGGGEVVEGESGEVTEPTGGAEPTEATEGQKTTGKQAATDPKRMAPALREHLAELQAKNPALAKEIKEMYWNHRGLQKQIAEHFPAGLAEAVELKQAIEEYGGKEGITELNAEIQDFRAVDQMISAGNADVVKTIFEQFPEGATKIAPAVISEWKARDPQGYDRFHAGQTFELLRDTDFTANLSMALQYLKTYDLSKNPQLAEAVSLLTGNMDWVNNLRKISSSQPKPAEAPGSKVVDQREQAITQREQAIVLKGIMDDVNQFAHPKINELVTALSKGKPLSTGGKTEVVNKAMKACIGNAMTDKVFEKKYDALFDSGDIAGAKKLLISKVDGMLTSETEKAYKYLFGEGTLGTKKPGTTGKPATGAPAVAGTQAPAGFALIGYDPKPASIDYTKTSKSMLWDNKAVLKNGKKVTWKPGAPAEK